MSVSAQLHQPDRADFSKFQADEFCQGFFSLKIRGEGFGVSILINKNSQELLFLSQLRHAVNEAIKWAIQ